MSQFYIKSILSFCCSSLLCFSTISTATETIDSACVLAANTQAQMDNCSKKQYVTADAALNQIYRQVRNSLDKNTQKILLKAQRHWLTFRDAECSAYIARHPAIQHLSLRQICMANLTETRTINLQNTYLLPPQKVPALDLKAIDRQLNSSYKKLMKQLQAPSKGLLRSAQRLWIPFRNAHCAAEEKQGKSKTYCLAVTTQTRVQHLEITYLGNNQHNNALIPNHQSNQLLGTWQGLQGESAIKLSFGVEQGVHFYISRLNGIPFETGQWVFNGASLNIDSNTGQRMHHYESVSIQQDMLVLQESDGAMLHYQKISSEAQP